MTRRRVLTLLSTLVTAVATAVTAAPPAGADPSANSPRAHCGRIDRITVPGAERQLSACLADLTTAGTTLTGHTQPSDYLGLHAPGTVNPSGVPGIQIDGYFPDTSTMNTFHGWNHDAQFVIRLPDKWNGGLVVSGAPGVRRQYANDFIIGDWVLAQGYAFASTDKGNSGLDFWRDGVEPGDAIMEGNLRVTELTIAAKAVLKQRYAKPVSKTYLYGVSNGGYLVRWQLENRPELYDGGMDWEGTLYTPEHNALRYFPAALRNWPAYAAGDPAAHQAILAAGFFPGSEYLWPLHWMYYWDGTQRVYREEFDPTFDGDTFAPDGTPGRPFCYSGPGCDTLYDLDSRPAAIEAIRKVSLTGRIGKPLITIHGTFDSLLPIKEVSDVYAAMVRDAGRGDLFRYYRFEGANHFDGLPAIGIPTRPLLPCSRAAFEALEAWTAHSNPKRNTAPPPDATLPVPGPGVDQVNSCSLR